MSAIRGEFTPVGAKIDGVTDRSLFAKVGLKTGDIVTAVDGKPICTIDDAAELYATRQPLGTSRCRCSALENR